MIIYIEKPKGITSYDLIHKLKKLYPRKTKIGHAWTLDPMATGLMIVAVGKDTKRLQEFVWLDKTYTATIDFSKKSDTWDMDHWEYFEQLDIEALSLPTEQDIHNILSAKLWASQRPLTPFSAKKVKGKKLYEYAREWSPIFIDINMELIDFQIINWTAPVLELQLHVWSGTYIRSIAHWLGEQFWCGGILTALHRSKVGEIEI